MILSVATFSAALLSFGSAFAGNNVLRRSPPENEKLVMVCGDAADQAQISFWADADVSSPKQVEISRVVFSDSSMAEGEYEFGPTIGGTTIININKEIGKVYLSTEGVPDRDVRTATLEMERTEVRRDSTSMWTVDFRSSQSAMAYEMSCHWIQE
jgi:hypothetical protein